MADDSLTHLDRRASRGRRSALCLAALALGVLAGCDRLAAEVAGRRAKAPAASAPVGLTRVDVERELARRLPHLVLTFPETDTTAAPAPYRLLRFTYESAGPRRPREHGHGLVLWRHRDYMPLWHVVRPGDFPPHSLYWTDANRDGRVDLFFLAGDGDVRSTFVYVDRGGPGAFTDSAFAGDVRSTFVYVDRGGPGAFTDSAFALAYASANDYSSLVDLDADGTPEIIDSGHRGRVRVAPAGCADLELPRRLRGPLAREYRRIAGDFDDANYRFGKTDDELATVEARAEHAFERLRLLHPVKIVTVHGTRSVNLAPEFPDHLRWRIGILTELRKELRAPKQRRCRRTVEGVIKHLRRDVAKARRGPYAPGTAGPRARPSG